MRSVHLKCVDFATLEKNYQLSLSDVLIELEGMCVCVEARVGTYM
jgi:hypothetical protein